MAELAEEELAALTELAEPAALALEELAADDAVPSSTGLSKNVMCTEALTVPVPVVPTMRESNPAVLSEMLTESMLHGYDPFANARTTFSASATDAQL